MKLACLSASLIAGLLVWSSAASAQRIDRPLPADKRVGIVYRSALGRTTTNTREQDQLAEATFAETEQTLRRLGYDVMNRAEVVTRLIESDVNCPDGVHNCPPREVLRALDLGAVVLVALWWDRSPADVAIEVTTSNAMGTAKGRLDVPVNKQIPSLIAVAMEDLRGGRAVDVTINALPLGAQVRIDGELVGKAPITAQLPPGPHEALLAYPGYVTTAHHFDVPRGGEPMTVHVSLEPAGPRNGNGARSIGKANEVTAAWDYGAAAVLGVAGGLLLVTPVLSLAQEGDCDSNIKPCEPIQFGPRATWQLVGGLAAIAGGVFMVAATPIRASLSSDGESLHASVHGHF